MATDFKLAAILEFVNKAGPGVKSAEKDFGGLVKAAKALGIGLSVAGVKIAAKAAYELGVLGAQSLRTKRAFEAISGGALSAADNLDAMRRATRGAMSEQAMMASANQLLQMGLAGNAAELENITTMATRLGSAMGKEAGPAVAEFSLMLANQSIPRLDTFGISASKVRTRILELQAATPGLSREMAFMTATMEEGEAAMERLGDAADDELLANERLAASWADLKAMAGEALAPAMETVANAMDSVTGRVLETHREIEELKAVVGETAVEMAAAEDYTDDFAAAWGDMGGEIVFVGHELEALEPKLDDSSGAMDLLRQRAEGVRAAVESGRSQIDGWSSAILVTADAAGEAAGAMEGLATSAKTVASSFGEMEFDNEQLWKMAAASGANLTELESLARHLGIASSAEIEAAKSAYALVEGFGAGTVSATELAGGFRDLRLAEAEATIEARAAEEGIEMLRGGMQEAGETATGLADDFGTSASALTDVERAARDAQDALNAIERDIDINITYAEHGVRPPGTGGGGGQQFQTGTAFHRGGWALIGETGPELVALPRGSRVWPMSAPQTRAAVNNRYNYGGDTVIINDRLAAALYLESRRRERIQRIERM